MTLQLYSYWRSSTSYKVRIALNIKQIDYDILPVHLVQDGGRQHSDDYKILNPMAAVPTLVDNGHNITQSNAILEYLEEQYPGIPLLPSEINARAFVRQIMNVVSCDIHPVNNLRVLQTLSNDLNVNDDDRKKWYHKWIKDGFAALEVMIKNSPYYQDNGFCAGEAPGFAECTLIPQIYNARRFNVDMTPYKVLEKIEAHCLTLGSFINAAPENQPDAE